MAKSDWNLNDSVMPEDMNQIGQEINDMAESLDNHINATLVHGATDAATPNRIARRDANGQFEVGVPTAANHVARKADLDEVKQSVSDGKNQIASAITGMGQTASGSDTFAQLSGKIRDISKDANAAVGDVLTGKTFYQGGVKRTGTMAVATDRSAPANIGTDGDGRFMVAPARGYWDGGKWVKTSLQDRANITPAVSVGRNDSTIYLRMPQGVYRTNAGFGYPELSYTEPNLLASNIKSGVSLFGLTGSLRPWNGEKRMASGTLTVASNSSGFWRPSIRNLAFRPSIVVTWMYNDTNTSQSIAAITSNSDGQLVNGFVYYIGTDRDYHWTTSTGTANNQFQILSNGFDILAFHWSGVPAGVNRTVYWWAYE